MLSFLVGIFDNPQCRRATLTLRGLVDILQMTMSYLAPGSEQISCLTSTGAAKTVAGPASALRATIETRILIERLS